MAVGGTTLFTPRSQGTTPPPPTAPRGFSGPAHLDREAPHQHYSYKNTKIYCLAGWGETHARDRATASRVRVVCTVERGLVRRASPPPSSPFDSSHESRLEKCSSRHTWRVSTIAIVLVDDRGDVVSDDIHQNSSLMPIFLRVHRATRRERLQRQSTYLRRRARTFDHTRGGAPRAAALRRLRTSSTSPSRRRRASVPPWA